MKIFHLLLLPLLLLSSTAKGTSVTIDEFSDHILKFTASWDPDHYGEIVTTYLPVTQLGPVGMPRITLDELTWHNSIEMNFDFVHPGYGSHFITIGFPMFEPDPDDPNWWQHIDRKAADATIHDDGSSAPQINAVAGNPYALQFVYATPDAANTLVLLAIGFTVAAFLHRRNLKPKAALSH
jgi:hypothetical protein